MQIDIETTCDLFVLSSLFSSHLCIPINEQVSFILTVKVYSEVVQRFGSQRRLVLFTIAAHKHTRIHSHTYTSRD